MSEGSEKVQRLGGWIPPGDGQIIPLGEMLSVHRHAAGHPVKPKAAWPRRFARWIAAFPRP